MNFGVPTTSDSPPNMLQMTHVGHTIWVCPPPSRIVRVQSDASGAVGSNCACPPLTLPNGKGANADFRTSLRQRMEQIDFGDFFVPLALPAASSAEASGEHEQPGERSSADDLRQDGAGPAPAHAPVAPEAQEQIVLPHGALELPAKTPMFQQRSAAHVAHARAAKALKAERERNAKAEEKAKEAQAALATVKTLLPDVSILLGNSAHKVVSLRQKRLEPKLFLLLTRALHLPATSKVNLGVKLRRLICFAAAFVLHRQRVALRAMLEASHKSLHMQLHGGSAGGQKSVHVSYTHIWDEVRAQFKGRVDQRYRQQTQVVATHTLVQEGVVGFTLCDASRQALCVSREKWICAPIGVKAVTAAGLHPGIQKAWPACFSITDVAVLQGLVQNVSSYTFMPLCDRASSNLAILKYWGQQWENEVAPKVGPKVLFWAECCGVHQYHRAKMQVKGLKFHTMRHFSIANLYRTTSIRGRMVEWLETNVPKLVHRVVGPVPPETRHTLRVFVDVLFVFDSGHHKRKGKGSQQGVSQNHADMCNLCDIVNCDLRGERLVHHCWNAESRRPCCANQEQTAERVTVAIVNALLGTCDPIPAESRWTHLLSNMKRTLLRYAVFRVGIDSFVRSSPHDAAPPADVNVDDQAASSFLQEVHKSRVQKTREYYQQDRNLHELAVYAVMLETCDSRLLYPLLGDPIKDPELPCKINLLLNRRQSLIGSCLSGLLHLLQSWSNGGPQRRPWCILEVLRVPAADPNFARWARGQILRMCSAVFRRFEVQYSGYPFRLFPLVVPDQYTLEERTQVAQRLLEADRKVLDTYSAGLRRLFPNIDDVLSMECKAVLAHDFASQGHGTDCVERANAELVARTPRRAPGRNLATAARESVLRQVEVVHRTHGGSNPLGRGVLGERAKVERLHMMPLLPASEGHPLMIENVPETPAPQQLLAAPAAPASPLRPPDALIALPKLEPKFEKVVVERPNPALLIAAATETSASKVETTAQVKRGLNPYLLQKNLFLKTVRENKGSTLTTEERAKADADFKSMWSRMGDQDVYKQAYEEWQAEGPPDVALQPLTYTPIWGGGCHATPITKEEMYDWHKVAGWPSDAEACWVGVGVSLDGLNGCA